jgi:hypothetical protein
VCKVGLFYRLGQFWRILTAEPLPTAAYQEIAATLNEAELALFGRYTAADQWHSYQVFNALRQGGHKEPALLTAALLHDVGKTIHPLSLWERTLIVLAQVICPGWAAVWGQSEARGWRRPFVVKAQHPAWGAEMAQAAGSAPLAVALIRRHQDKVLAETAEERLLRRLQWADDQH